MGTLAELYASRNTWPILTARAFTDAILEQGKDAQCRMTYGASNGQNVADTIDLMEHDGYFKCAIYTGAIRGRNRYRHILVVEQRATPET